MLLSGNARQAPPQPSHLLVRYTRRAQRLSPSGSLPGHNAPTLARSVPCTAESLTPRCVLFANTIPPPRNHRTGPARPTPPTFPALRSDTMDSAELAHIFDAIAGGTCAERFLSTLAADSPADNPAVATSDLPIPTPAFDMPVVAAQASLPLDSLPPTASPVPPPLVSHPVLDTPYLLPEYSLPGSAVTGSYRSNTNSAVRETTIQKKKRTRSQRLKKERSPILAMPASAPNVSFASDISAVTPDDISVSHTKPRELPPKPEPCLPADRAPRSTPQTSTPARPLSANPLSVLTNLSPAAPPSAASLSASPSAPTPPKSHTRKCREKVTRQFENLLEVLPNPPRGVEVKHKAQVLGYTINVFKELLLRRTLLQAEIALASRPALLQWMNSAITSAAACMNRESRAEPVPLSAVLEPFLGLYCVKNKWAYGELWLVDPDKQQASLSSCVFNSDNSDVLQRLDVFAAESRNRFQVPWRVESGMISRAMACHRPEWLEQPASDPSVFSRADVASSQGICLVETIPIVIGKERCSAVLLFADVKPHTFSTTDMSVAKEYAEVISEGYVQYLQRAQRRCVAGHVDGRIQAKPICSAETKPGLSNQGMTSERRFGDMSCGAPGKANGMISQTETSSRFFSDSDLMTRRCL